MAKIKGLPEVLKNLNNAIKEIEGASLKGLILASAQVRYDMDKTPPLIPVDLGNLRGSWTIQALRSGESPAVRIGFLADYAWYVHENVGANFQRPGAGAKFFEAALNRNHDTILNIIRTEL